MPDEEVTTDPVPEEEEAAPDPLAEERAAIEADKAAIAAEKASIEKRAKDLERGFNEIAARERATQPKPEPEPVEGLTPEAEKALEAFNRSRGYLTKDEVEERLNQFNQFFIDQAFDELDAYAKSHDIDADALRETIGKYNYVPEDYRKSSIREVFDKAARVMKASDFDPEAERERIRKEERAKLYEEAAEKGHVIEGIAPKRTEPDESATLDDPDIDTDTRLRLLKEKHAGFWNRSH